MSIMIWHRKNQPYHASLDSEQPFIFCPKGKLNECRNDSFIPLFAEPMIVSVLWFLGKMSVMIWHGKIHPYHACRMPVWNHSCWRSCRRRTPRITMLSERKNEVHRITAHLSDVIDRNLSTLESCILFISESKFRHILITDRPGFPAMRPQWPHTVQLQPRRIIT